MIQFTFCYMVSKCTFHEALIRSSMGSTPLTRRVDNVTNNGVTELSSSSAFVFPLVASPPVTLVSWSSWIILITGYGKIKFFW